MGLEKGLDTVSATKFILAKLIKVFLLDLVLQNSSPIE